MKQQTYTSTVLAVLREADDLLTREEILAQARVPINCNQLSAALIHLQKYRAVERVGDHYMATPGIDTRMWTQEERTPETAPRRRRRRPSLLDPEGPIQ